MVISYNLFLLRWTWSLQKILWKDPCFSNEFLRKIYRKYFSSLQCMSCYVGARKIVNSLFSTYPLKRWSYKLLSIRENRIEKISAFNLSAATGPCTTTTVGLFYIANFVVKKNLLHCGISMVYFLYIALIYQGHYL